MKKLVLILAVFMAFAVKSFAYSNYYNKMITLSEAGKISETICLNCVYVEYSMGCQLPGYVVIEAYNGYNSYSDFVSTVGGYEHGVWDTPLLDLRVTIEVWVDNQNPSYHNGVNLTWATN